MKDRAQELKGEGRAKREARADPEAALLAKIAEMPDVDRVLAERIHVIVTEAAPELAPKLWYGMPSYALPGKVLCCFQPADKFDSRYATFGFNDIAMLDDGTMWPTSFAITEPTPEHEATIAALVKKSVS